MSIYQQVLNMDGVVSTATVKLTPATFIPCDPANTDYQRFKTEINADEAQLEDSDGVLMTAEEAKAFVATLP